MNRWNGYKSFIQLIGLLCAVPLVAWFLGFRGTVASWWEYREKLALLEKLQTTADGTNRLQVNDDISVEPVLQDGRWLEKLSPVLAEGKSVVYKYSPYLLRAEGDVRVDVGELILAGDFISLVKLLDFIERNKTFGKVVSVGFNSSMDRVKKKKQLKMTLWIQQLSMNRPE